VSQLSKAFRSLTGTSLTNTFLGVGQGPATIAPSIEQPKPAQPENPNTKLLVYGGIAAAVLIVAIVVLKK
jgi:hypothetical protein